MGSTELAIRPQGNSMELAILRNKELELGRSFALALPDYPIPDYVMAKGESLQRQKLELIAEWEHEDEFQAITDQHYEDGQQEWADRWIAQGLCPHCGGDAVETDYDAEDGPEEVNCKGCDGTGKYISGRDWRTMPGPDGRTFLDMRDEAREQALEERRYKLDQIELEWQAKLARHEPGPDPSVRVLSKVPEEQVYEIQDAIEDLCWAGADEREPYQWPPSPAWANVCWFRKIPTDKPKLLEIIRDEDDRVLGVVPVQGTAALRELLFRHGLKFGHHEPGYSEILTVMLGVPVEMAGFTEQVTLTNRHLDAVLTARLWTLVPAHTAVIAAVGEYENNPSGRRTRLTSGDADDLSKSSEVVRRVAQLAPFRGTATELAEAARWPQRPVLLTNLLRRSAAELAELGASYAKTSDRSPVSPYPFIHVVTRAVAALEGAA